MCRARRAYTPVTRRRSDKIVSVRNQATKFTSAEEGEALALQLLLTEPMNTFLTFWEEALATLEEGKPVTINITREMLEGWTVSSSNT